MLRVVRLRDQVPSGGLVADRPLYLAADRATVVEEGDPRAAWLLAGAGGLIPQAEADRLGLVSEGGRVRQRAQPAEHKMRAPGEDK